MTERFLTDLNDVLHFNSKTFISNYRLHRAVVLQLAEQLQSDLEQLTRHHGPLPVMLQLANTLRFLREVSAANSNVGPTYIQFPRGKSSDIKPSQMPGVIGLVDGSLLPTKAHI